MKFGIQIWVILVFGLSLGRADYYCESEGLFLDEDGDLCKDYYQCIQLQETWFYVLGSCENGTILNSADRICAFGQCQPATTPIRSTDATNSTTIEPPETTPEPRTEVSTTTTARTTSTTLATTKLTTWSTTPRLTATTKLPTTKYPTTARPVQFQCISDGYFGDPSNCEIYHALRIGEAGFTMSCHVQGGLCTAKDAEYRRDIADIHKIVPGFLA